MNLVLPCKPKHARPHFSIQEITDSASGVHTLRGDVGMFDGDYMCLLYL